MIQLSQPRIKDRIRLQNFHVIFLERAYLAANNKKFHFITQPRALDLSRL